MQSIHGICRVFLFTFMTRPEEKGKKRIQEENARIEWKQESVSMICSFVKSHLYRAMFDLDYQFFQNSYHDLIGEEEGTLNKSKSNSSSIVTILRFINNKLLVISRTCDKSDEINLSLLIFSFAERFGYY